MPLEHRRRAVGTSIVVAAVILIVAVVGTVFVVRDYNVSPAANQSTSISTTSQSISTSTGSFSGSTTTASTTYYSTALYVTTTNHFLIYEFGDSNIAPDGIYIPANTLVWVDFVYPQSLPGYVGSLSVGFNVFVYGSQSGLNVTTGFYGSNGQLLFSATGGMAGMCQVPENDCDRMGDAPNGTADQVVAIPGGTLTVGFGASDNNVTVTQGSTFSIAFVANEGVWVSGWSSIGSGITNGQSPYQVLGTDGASGSYATLPAMLPPAATTSSFEMAASVQVMNPQ